MTEFGTAPGKNVPTDVSKSGLAMRAFAGSGVAVSPIDAIDAVVSAALMGANIRASLADMIPSLSCSSIELEEEATR